MERIPQKLVERRRPRLPRSSRKRDSHLLRKTEGEIVVTI